MSSDPTTAQSDRPATMTSPEAALDMSSTGAATGAVSVHAVVRDLVARHGRLAVPIDRLTDGSDLYGAGLTSLATVGLMLALEEGFDIEFPDALLSRKTFGSIDALAAAVRTLRAR